MTTNIINKNCLICNTSTSSHLRPKSPHQSSHRLSHQLLSVFLLRNVFELSAWTLQECLVNSMGANPSQWFAICQKCDLQVRQIKALHDQVLKAKRQFQEAKQNLVEKVKLSKSKEHRRKLSKISNLNPSNFTDEFREFVEIYDYGQLDTRNSSEVEFNFEGGGDGDNETITDQNDDLATMNVKTEILEEMPNEPEMNDYFTNETHFSLMEEKVAKDWSPASDLPEEGDDYDDHDQDHEADEDASPSPPKRRRKCPPNFKHEIEFAEAKAFVQFLETNKGGKMVRYDGHNYHYKHDNRKPKSVTPENYVSRFYCVRSRNRKGGCGCSAKIGLRNFNPEDSTYTSFIPTATEHSHDHDDTKKYCKMYEIKALAKEIVKANVETSIPQVFQMIQENFAGDPEASQELGKVNVQNNVKKLIGNMKRKLGWNPEATATPRRRERRVANLEVGFAEVGTSLQFMLTTHGKRMVRYEGHNYYYNDGRYRVGDVTYFNCMMRRTKQGCLARLGLRNYDDEDCSYTSLIPNADPHEHNSTKKTSVMYEVNALTKEIVKDNVDMPTTRIFQMIQDSFINDAEAVEELSKEKVQNNLRKLIGNMKRRLGWKPPDDAPRPPRPRPEQNLEQREVVELGFAEVGSSLQFLLTTHGKRMVRYEGHNFYYKDGRYRAGDLTHFYCMMRRPKHCYARVSLRNYKDEDCSFTSFIPNSVPHNHDPTKSSVMYEVNALAKQIVKDNVDMPVPRVFQMVQDSFMSDPEATQELEKLNVQNSVKKLIENTRKRLGWKPEVKQRKGTGRSRKRKRKRAATSEESGGGGTEVIIDKPQILDSFIDQILQ